MSQPGLFDGPPVVRRPQRRSSDRKRSDGGHRMLVVRAHLASPVAASGPLHLDALLSRIYMVRHRGYQGVPRLKLARIAARDGWVWASTAWLPGGPVAADWLTRRKDGVDEEERIRKWDPNSGPERNLMQSTVVYHVPTIEWLCCGNREAIRRDLRMQRSIGQRRRHGFGRVTRWEVSRVDADPLDVLVDADGLARRSMPAQWLASGSVVSGATMAPYYDSDNRCPVAEVGRPVTLHPEVLRAAASVPHWRGEAADGTLVRLGD